MALKLKELHVKNFKSLHNVVITLDDFNILVGANMPGKVISSTSLSSCSMQSIITLWQPSS